MLVRKRQSAQKETIEELQKSINSYNLPFKVISNPKTKVQFIHKGEKSKFDDDVFDLDTYFLEDSVLSKVGLLNEETDDGVFPLVKGYMRYHQALNKQIQTWRKKGLVEHDYYRVTKAGQKAWQAEQKKQNLATNIKAYFNGPAPKSQLKDKFVSAGINLTPSPSKWLCVLGVGLMVGAGISAGATYLLKNPISHNVAAETGNLKTIAKLSAPIPIATELGDQLDPKVYKSSVTFQNDAEYGVELWTKDTGRKIVSSKNSKHIPDTYWKHENAGKHSELRIDSDKAIYKLALCWPAEEKYTYDSNTGEYIGHQYKRSSCAYELFVTDLETNETIQLTNSEIPKNQLSVENGLIVWKYWSNDIDYIQSGLNKKFESLDNNNSDDERGLIKTNTFGFRKPVVHNGWLFWQAKEELKYEVEGGDRDSDFNIYMMNLAPTLEGKVIKLTNSSNNEVNVSISEDWLTYEFVDDNGNSEIRARYKGLDGKFQAGNNSKSDDLEVKIANGQNPDIYKDLISYQVGKNGTSSVYLTWAGPNKLFGDGDDQTLLVANNASNVSIGDNLIAWEDRTNGYADIYGAEISFGPKTQINSNNQSNPNTASYTIPIAPILLIAGATAAISIPVVVRYNKRRKEEPAIVEELK